MERDLAKNERINELRKISDIYKDREGNEVRSAGVTEDTVMQQKKKNLVHVFSVEMQPCTPI